MSRQIGLLFQAPMVRSIGLDLKTLTRRTKGLEEINIAPDEFIVGQTRVTDKNVIVAFEHKKSGGFAYVECPYGKPGDLYWVRETFSKIHYEGVDKNPSYIYRADETMDKVKRIWKPSIHMPKDATRYWLKCKSIRPERIQDITEADAIAEGVESIWIDLTTQTCQYRNYLTGNFCFDFTAKDSFQSLIVSINGPEIWGRNQWVWRIEFERTNKPRESCQ